jgi:hypothetical protein
MKSIYIPLIALGSAAILFSFHIQEKGTYGVYNAKKFHILNSGGASAGNTGAPRENNSTACHSGTVQSGDGVNLLDWGSATSYTPGETYDITLTLNDAAAKNGFQLTALNESNLPSGTITATDAAATQVLTGVGGKQYLGHRLGGNTLSSWSFEWTAPSTADGPVTFYVATNKTNSSSSATGDLIRLSQHVFDAPNTSSLTQFERIKSSLVIALSKEQNTLNFAFETDAVEDMFVNVFSLQGQAVLTESLGTTNIGKNTHELSLTSDLTSGAYVVHLLMGNKAFSQKIIVQ